VSHTTVEGRPEVELSWYFDSAVWNRGYATELAREAVRVAFEVLELDDVVAFTTPGNGASRAVLEKLGMAYERDIVHAGLPHVLYRLGR
jgi:ribosomal-protein-alanine N-acetyltransferase